MKEELKQLWKEYSDDCKRREQEYFEAVVRDFGPYLYAPNKNNLPSFEGFMDFISSR